MNKRPSFGEIDLTNDVLPITKAIPVLAELIKRTRIKHSHILITQNGYPAAVLVSIDDYTQMRELALQALDHKASQE